LKHFYQDIQGWSNFLDLTRLLVLTLPEKGLFVEVGTWKGRSAAFAGVEILRHRPSARLILIDTWQGSDEPAHKADPIIQAGRLFEHCKENLAPLGRLPEYIRATSGDAALTFASESLDVVFLDAAHDYENVKADLVAWAGKVKPGGYLAGDDMEWQGVRDAVLEYFEGKGDWSLCLSIGPTGYPAWYANKKARD
jgi:hypothetical protein